MPGVPFFAYAASFVRSAMRDEADFPGSIVAIPGNRVRNAKSGRIDADEAALIFEARFVTDIDDLHEVTASSAAVTAETGMMKEELNGQIGEILDLAIGSLTTQEAEIIRLRLIDGGTGEELGSRLDMPAARVRKIEKRAMARMKTLLLKRGITADFINTGI
jgi:RNA polymerase sigma factor (sigma-70 family)